MSIKVSQKEFHKTKSKHLSQAKKLRTLMSENLIDWLKQKSVLTDICPLSSHQIPLPDALPKLVLPRHGAAMPASGLWTGRTPPAPHTPWPLTGDYRRHAPLDLWTRRATATASAPRRIQVGYKRVEGDQYRRSPVKDGPTAFVL